MSVRVGALVDSGDGEGADAVLMGDDPGVDADTLVAGTVTLVGCAEGAQAVATSITIAKTRLAFRFTGPPSRCLLGPAAPLSIFVLQIGSRPEGLLDLVWIRFQIAGRQFRARRAETAPTRDSILAGLERGP
jgi:hypothetical protein